MKPVPCPYCGGSLEDTVHIHDGEVAWRTDLDGVVLLTDERGCDPVFLDTVEREETTR